MPKTGSTAVQRTFAGQDLGHVRYFRWCQPNYGDLVTLLFDEQAKYFMAHILKGYSREELLPLREEWLEGTSKNAGTCEDSYFVPACSWGLRGKSAGQI